MFLVGLTFVMGGLHIAVSNLANGIFSPPSRPFLEDFLHLYQKRWFQNILIFAVFSKLIEQVLIYKPANFLKNCNLDADKFRVLDGKNTHWVNYSDIRYVEVGGNYLIVHVGDKRLITRQTLKNAEEEMFLRGFLKVNRSCLINPKYIKHSARVSRSCVELHMGGGGIVTISRKYWPTVKTLLK